MVSQLRQCAHGCRGLRGAFVLCESTVGVAMPRRLYVGTVGGGHEGLRPGLYA